jgi:cytochrome bd-type quinol oxidase subunit 2
MPFSRVFLLADLSAATINGLMILGLGSFFAGIMLMMAHRRHWLQVMANEREQRVRRYEYNKFRRRSLAAALISALGTVLVATVWVREPRVFALLMLLMLAILIMLLFVAALDFLAVGAHHMTRNDAAAEKEMIRTYHELKARKEADDQSHSESEPQDGNSKSPAE